MKQEVQQHLHHYLPHKLQLKCTAIFQPNRNEYPIIKGADATLTADLYADIVNGTYRSIGNFIPIMRPLDLAKEIEHNGERFVPIQEIAKIEAPNITDSLKKIHSITKFNRGVSSFSQKMGVTYIYEGVTVEITHYKDAIFHKKVICGNDSWVFSYFHNYPVIIQKLHEWHFDIYGLIEAGSAIDINTIK